MDNDWIEHNGPCPVDRSVKVYVKLENGQTFNTPDPAGFWDGDVPEKSSWGHRNGEDGIVAYKVAK